MTATRGILVSLGLVVAGCIVALILAEATVRVFYPHSRDHVIPGGLFAIDDTLGWKLQGGRVATHRSQYFEVSYRINADGYRDPPRRVEREGTRYRMLLYGDSQVFGWGITAAQRFSNLLEAGLPETEVWNLAVPGYGLDQQILSYEEDAKNFQVNEVIFFASKSTLERMKVGYIYKKNKPRFLVDQQGRLQLLPVKGSSQAWTNLAYRVLSPLYLPYFLERQFTRISNAHREPRERRAEQTQPESLVLTGLEKKILERAKTVADERGHRMTVIAHLSESIGRGLQEICNRSGIEFILLELSRENDDLVLGKHDPHWNALAHKLIAAQLRAHWRARGHALSTARLEQPRLEAVKTVQ